MNFAIEGTTRSKSEWMATLELSERDFTELVERSVLSPEAAGFRLSFVGFVILARAAAVCLPKYTTSANGVSSRDTLTLQAVLRRYRERKAHQQAAFRDDVRELAFEDEAFAREYEVYLTLLEWYQANGIYKEAHRSEASSRSAAIHWPKTFGRKLALHGPRAIIYDEPVQQSARQRVCAVSAIVLSALRTLGAKYRVSGPDPTWQADVSPYPVLESDQLREQAHVLAPLVGLERARTFRTDTLAMLGALERYLTDLRRLDGPPRVALWGTGSFHVVWEDACAATFGSETISLSQPRWFFAASGEDPPIERAGGEQRPDIVARAADRLLLLDAKYYYPLPESRCGWGDLVKQFFYERSLDLVPGAQVTNALLFPDPASEGLETVGVVKMMRGKSRDERFPPISVVRINPHRLFDSYVRAEAHAEWTTSLLSNH